MPFKGPDMNPPEPPRRLRGAGVSWDDAEQNDRQGWQEGAARQYLTGLSQGQLVDLIADSTWGDSFDEYCREGWEA